MKLVEPRVYLLAEPALCLPGIKEWLTDVGADANAVMSRMVGSDSEKLIELAARRCYKSFEVGLNPNIKQIREDSNDYHGNILKSGHGSVMEHANFTIAFEFVSRVFTHELVRHRAGCAFSQESLRYVRLTELGFWMPPEIEAEPHARRIFTDAVKYLESCQRQLEEGFNAELNGGNFSRKKKLTSAFRRIAPEGLATGIVVTCNVRALRHIFERRTDSAAEHEIRLAVGLAFNLLARRHPMLFQDFEATDVDGLSQWAPKFSKV